MNMTLKTLVKVLDAKAQIKVFEDKKTIAFEGCVWELYSCEEEFMNKVVEDMFINEFNGNIVNVLLRK